MAARATGTSLYRAAAELVTTDELRPNTRSSLGNLIADFERWRALSGDGREGLAHSELAEMVLDESGYTEMLMNDKSPEAPGRLENLKELVVAMEEFENLTGFLEHVSLVMENTEAAGSDLVNLMTLHSAKGLEFDTVFLPGWEEGLFPHQRNMDENGLAGLEEERRLAYVGLTRAKREATILFAANRRVHGQWQSAIPSRFVDELPPEHVDVDSEPGVYAGNQDMGGFGRGRALGYGGGQSRAPKRDMEASLIHADPQGFGIGERVFHQKFGYGRITAIDANKLAIAFEKAGDKKVLDSFVVPADAA